MEQKVGSIQWKVNSRKRLVQRDKRRLLGRDGRKKNLGKYLSIPLICNG